MADPEQPQTETPQTIRRRAWEEAPRYRSFVGPPHKYDLIAAMQFRVFTSLGLREHHYLLDIGCGSLRAGRLFIPYLLPDHYFGIEPEPGLVEEGIEKELGRDAIRIKRPTFSDNDDFRLTIFDRRFDFMVAHSIFTHAAVSQIRACLAEAKKALEDDGTFAATYIPDESNYEGEGWSNRAFYRPEFMESLAAEAGLDVADLGWPHPNVRQHWLLFRHEGAAELVSRVTPPAAG
jgi:SAM-dependent methyltransferase